MNRKYQPVKNGCYVTYVGMAFLLTISPILFVTFREAYGISYTKLGLLVLLNFVSQLSIDLIFSFFSEKFNIPMTLRIMPLITVAGILIYALMPLFFPESAYLWISAGTIVFSISAGLCEVLLSPTIAAIPSDNPDREMSKLHSVYAWGAVFAVAICVAYLKLIGEKYWYYLALLVALFPVVAFILFCKGTMPPMTSGVTEEKGTQKQVLTGALLFVACIFFGSAAENTMSQWCSSYVEKSLGIDKFWGDIAGLALFAVMLGIARTLYAKKGKNISAVLLIGFSGATVTYLVASLSDIPAVGLIACALTGLFVSMLWPGTLIYIEKVYPGCGVVIYALLAAGGDLGASVAPQLMGIISDAVAESSLGARLAETLHITAEQAGLKAGMLLLTVFPIAGIVTVLTLRAKHKQ